MISPRTSTGIVDNYGFACGKLAESEARWFS
jgi:hypothetical protein